MQFTPGNKSNMKFGSFYYNRPECKCKKPVYLKPNSSLGYSNMSKKLRFFEIATNNGVNGNLQFGNVLTWTNIIRDPLTSQVVSVNKISCDINPPSNYTPPLKNKF